MATKLLEAYVEIKAKEQGAVAAVRKMRQTVKRETEAASKEGGKAAELLTGHYKKAGESIEHGLVHAFGGIGRMFMHGGLLGVGALLAFETIREGVSSLFEDKDAEKIADYHKELAHLNSELVINQQRMDYAVGGQRKYQAAVETFNSAKEEMNKLLGMDAKGVPLGGAEKQEFQANQERGALQAFRATHTIPEYFQRLARAKPGGGVISGMPERESLLGKQLVGEQIESVQKAMTNAAVEATKNGGAGGAAHLADIASYAEALTVQASSDGDKGDEQLEMLRVIAENTKKDGGAPGAIPPPKGPVKK